VANRAGETESWRSGEEQLRVWTCCGSGDGGRGWIGRSGLLALTGEGGEHGELGGSVTGSICSSFLLPSLTMLSTVLPIIVVLDIDQVARMMTTMGRVVF
jgi:hypothetical protein